MLDTAFRLAASPLLIAQALRVRRAAQSLPEPDGPREGLCGKGPLLRLGIIGDSSAAGVGASHQSLALSGQLSTALAARHRVEWHLDAVTGATTASTLARLAGARPRPLDAVVICLGVNDVTRLVPARVWVDRQARLIDRLTALHAPRRFYLAAMPPIERFPLLPEPLRWTLGRHARRLEARRLDWLAGRPAILHCPFEMTPAPEMVAPDGFHPSETLYALWAKQMASRILSDWPEES